MSYYWCTVNLEYAATRLRGLPSVIKACLGATCAMRVKRTYLNTRKTPLKSLHLGHRKVKGKAF